MQTLCKMSARAMPTKSEETRGLYWEYWSVSSVKTLDTFVRSLYLFNTEPVVLGEVVGGDRDPGKWSRRRGTIADLTLHYCRHLTENQSSGAVWKSRWPSWAPVPNKPTVSVDVKQHSTSSWEWFSIMMRHSVESHFNVSVNNNNKIKKKCKGQRHKTVFINHNFYLE